MKAQNLLLVERAMKFMPWTVQPSDSVAHARALLDEHRINDLPVLLKGRLVGIVSTRNLEARKLSQKAAGIRRALETHPDRVKVVSVMTTNVPIVRPSDTLQDAIDLMLRKHVGTLPVIEQGNLRGIINRSDIAGASLELAGRTTQCNLPSYRTGGRPRAPHYRRKRVMTECWLLPGACRANAT